MKKIAIFIIMSIMASITYAERGMLRGILMEVEPIDWIIKIDKRLKYKIVSIDRGIPVNDFWADFSKRYNLGITKDYGQKHVLIRKTLTPTFIELNKADYVGSRSAKLNPKEAKKETTPANLKKAKKERVKQETVKEEIISKEVLAEREKHHIESKAKVVSRAKEIKERMFAMQEDFYDKETELQTNVLKQKKVALSAEKVAAFKIKKAQDDLAELSSESKKKAELLKKSKEKVSSLERENAIKQAKLNALMASKGESKIRSYNNDSQQKSANVFDLVGTGFSGIKDDVKNIFSYLYDAGKKAGDLRRAQEEQGLVILSAQQKKQIEVLTEEAAVAKMEATRLRVVKDITQQIGVDNAAPVGNVIELEEEISTSAKEIRADIKASEQRQAKALAAVNAKAEKSIKIMESVIIELSTIAESVNLIRSKAVEENEYSDKVKLNKILNKIKTINKEISIIRKDNTDGLTDISMNVAKSATSISEDIIRLEEVIKSTMAKIVTISTDNTEVLREINGSTSGLDRNVKALRAKMDSMYYNIFNISTSLDSYQTQTKRGLQDISRETKTQTQSLKNLLNITGAGLYQGRTNEDKIKRLLNNLFDIESVDSINVGNKYDKESQERILAIHIDKMYLKSGEINNKKIIKNKDIVFKFSPEGLISIKGIKDNQTIRYVVNQWYHDEYKDFENSSDGSDLVTREDSEVLIFEKKSKYDPKENELSDMTPILYETHCYSCHESEYRGAIPMKDDRWDSILKAKGVSHLYSSVINGMDYMPRKGSCESCTEQEILSLIKYLSTE